MMPVPEVMSGYLAERRAEIEHALEHVLPPPPDCPAVVHDAMRYSLAAGGKRLRPILCLASAESVASRIGGLTDATARALAIPAACALELIHTYSLIHDDLPAMDDDMMRRGRPTLHVVAGEGMAILAGDGLLTEAFALLVREPVSSDAAIVMRKLKAIGVIAAGAGVTGMVGGQAIDLASVGGGMVALDAEGVKTMHAKKTGALIKASALAGAIMAGGDDATLAAIGDCGAQFGLAFQIVDDLLDVEGDSSHLGKTAGKDAAAGKPTYPALYGVAESRRIAAHCIERAESRLRAVGLDDARLLDIGRWVVTRTK